MATYDELRIVTATHAEHGSKAAAAGCDLSELCCIAAAPVAMRVQIGRHRSIACSNADF